MPSYIVAGRNICICFELCGFCGFLVKEDTKQKKLGQNVVELELIHYKEIILQSKVGVKNLFFR